MDTKTLSTLFSLAALVAASPGFAHGFRSFDGEEQEVEAESWPKDDWQREDLQREEWQYEQSDRLGPEDSRWVIEENRWDEYQERQEIETTRQDRVETPRQAEAVRDRFVNPRPDLGCMYFDENNIRHWYPNCREL